MTGLGEGESSQKHDIIVQSELPIRIRLINLTSRSTLEPYYVCIEEDKLSLSSTIALSSYSLKPKRPPPNTHGHNGQYPIAILYRTPCFMNSSNIVSQSPKAIIFVIPDHYSYWYLEYRQNLYPYPVCSCQVVSGEKVLQTTELAIVVRMV